MLLSESAAAQSSISASDGVLEKLDNTLASLERIAALMQKLRSK